MHKKLEEEHPEFKEARSHMKAARQALRQSVEDWLPAGFLQHRREARKEMLLAVRGLVDAAIEHLEGEKDEEAKA